MQNSECGKRKDGAPVGLAGKYEDVFRIGVALPDAVFAHMETYEAAILRNFNSITCENEMKPESLLDQEASRANGEPGHAAVRFDRCQGAIAFARKHGIKIRLHTLVWHSQTPRWFFTEDYTEDGALVGRARMLERMEHYIADVLEYFREQHPGLVYAVDVANEAFDVEHGDDKAIRKKKNLWYETVGADYYYQAFVYARRYAAKEMKLFYNDYDCMKKTDLILGHLAQAQAEGLIDGIGMQAHLNTKDPIREQFLPAAERLCAAGYELQITELDIGLAENTDADLQVQAEKYRALFEGLKRLKEKGGKITCITVWGLNDELSWRRNECGLLFTGEMEPKPAYWGAMPDPSVLNCDL